MDNYEAKNELNQIVDELYNRGILDKKEVKKINKKSIVMGVITLRKFLCDYICELLKDGYDYDYCKSLYQIYNKAGNIIDLFTIENEKFFDDCDEKINIFKIVNKKR